MPVYIVTGKLGSGKTLVCVGLIRDALLAGKKVATNLDLNLGAMLNPWHTRGEVLRIPDKPNVDDFAVCGLGNCDGSPEEETFGMMVLDELGSWLNSRQWGDKERAAVIDWLIHSRKHCWDVYLIVQNLSMIDKQVRESLAEFVVVCRRMDRLKVPLIGVRLPRVHLGIVRYGAERTDPVVERWVYRGRALYAAYDTRQIFRPRGWPGSVQAVTRLPMPGEVSKLRRPASWWRRLRGLGDPPPQPLEVPRFWPESVRSLSPEARWLMARRLFGVPGLTRPLELRLSLPSRVA